MLKYTLAVVIATVDALATTSLMEFSFAVSEINLIQL